MAGPLVTATSGETRTVGRSACVGFALVLLLVLAVLVGPVRGEIWIRCFVDHAALVRAGDLVRSQCGSEGYLAKPGSPEYGQLPSALQMGGVVAISQQEVRVVFGSGFLHWGLVLHEIQSSPATQRSWRTVQLVAGVTFFSELGGR